MKTLNFRRQFRVPVSNHMIEAAETDDGEILVSVKSVCESLGMGYGVQLTMLRSSDCDWATMTLREHFDRIGVTNSQGRPFDDKELAEIELMLKAISAEAISAELRLPVRRVRAGQAP